MSKHGHAIKGSETPTYRSWSSMRSRCNNKNCDSYGRYGAKGVSICERWNDFDNFLADMGERPEGTSIDRIDPTGNYEPGNCRWADRKTQGQNQAKTLYVEAFGERLPISDWEARFGVSRDAIKRRLDRGLPPEIAVSSPPHKGKVVSAIASENENERG